MGIRSTNGVNDHLRALQRKGCIRREDMKARSIRIAPDISGPFWRVSTDASEPPFFVRSRISPSDQAILDALAALILLLAAVGVLACLAADAFE